MIVLPPRLLFIQYRPIIAPAFSVLLAGCFAAEGFAQPLDHATRRPTPLHFGMHVTPDPADNPIDPPERFTGYHVATDYEVSADEVDAALPVYAVCAGVIVYSGFAEGYGGLLVQRCRLDGEPITVMYGHVSRNGLLEEGRSVIPGQRIGYLADARSKDADGNRKHLHLGIHKGKAIDMRGYVQSEESLAEYIDPSTVLLQEVPDRKAYWDTETGATT